MKLSVEIVVTVGYSPLIEPQVLKEIPNSDALAKDLSKVVNKYAKCWNGGGVREIVIISDKKPVYKIDREGLKAIPSE